MYCKVDIHAEVCPVFDSSVLMLSQVITPTEFIRNENLHAVFFSHIFL